MDNFKLIPKLFLKGEAEDGASGEDEEDEEEVYFIFLKGNMVLFQESIKGFDFEEDI